MSAGPVEASTGRASGVPQERGPFVVGIDLGTSNGALASADTRAGAGVEVRDLAIPQVIAPGEVGARVTLPSCGYRPLPGEFPKGSMALPWAAGTDPEWVVGEFARRHGARVPGRQVVSAKSWLCHPGVDRSAAILPAGAPPDMRRMSPVEASAGYLEHLIRAWETAHPGHRMVDQEVVVTVPASFDAVARALTVEAVRSAGLSDCSLVEEPQAAFEAFVFDAARRGDLARLLDGVRLVLVIDVGGGTTDFTLVRVNPGGSAEGPRFERLAVGDHLMLGGDNMDAALARRAEEQMTAGGRRLSAAAWAQCVQAAREAKESLLGENGPAEHRVAIAGQGRALMGGTLVAVLTREDVERRLVEGFLPACGPDERPRRGPRVALQELGLPFAQDVGITRHLAAFLAAHRESGAAALGEPAGDGLPRPDAILLNGGVFRSERLVRRVVEVVSGWWPGRGEIRVLKSESLDLAVARGAACHALARRGLSRRVGGGSARAYFVALESSKNAAAHAALCVMPRGQEEGAAVELGQRVFRLALGRRVQFPLFSSTADTVVPAGAIVERSDTWLALPPLRALLTRSRHGAPAGEVGVHLRAVLTPIGTLELWCVAEDGEDRWRLEFELRDDEADRNSEGLKPVASGTAGGTKEIDAPAVAAALPARYGEARRAVEEAFAAKTGTAGSGGSPGRAAKQLGSNLERVLGPREGWSPAVLRAMWDGLWDVAGRRRRTADHERAFFQWAGYALRPGYGCADDDARCERMASLFQEGVQFAQERPVWGEYWVAWRRVAGGLAEARQLELWRWMKPHLAYRISPGHPRHLGRPKGVQPEGLHEMVRLAASLELLPVAEKVEFGGWIQAQLGEPGAAGGPWAWALGRVGAREPLHGRRPLAVPVECAEAWTGSLLEAAGRGIEGAPFALSQVARRTGDTDRDLSDGLRERVLAVLREGQAPENWLRLVDEVVALDQADVARALGDTLPVGLRL